MKSGNEVQEPWASSTSRIAAAAIVVTPCWRSLSSAAPRERLISVVCRPWWAADVRTYPCWRFSSSIASKGRDMYEGTADDMPVCMAFQVKNR
jgi:hypothetical protein